MWRRKTIPLSVISMSSERTAHRSRERIRNTPREPPTRRERTLEDASWALNMAVDWEKVNALAETGSKMYAPIGA